MLKDIKRNYQIQSKINSNFKDSPKRKTPKKSKIKIKLSDMELTQQFIKTGNLLIQLAAALV